MNGKKFLLVSFAVLLTVLFPAGRFYCRHDQKQRMVLLSHSFGQQHPIHQFLVNVNQRIAAKSGNRLKLVIYDSAQLGAEPQFMEQIRVGVLDGGIVSNQMLTKFSPDFIFMQYPYMFKNESEARHFLNGFAEKKLSESLMKRNCNLTLCCSLTNGMNGFYFTGTPENFRFTGRKSTTYLACSIPPFCMKCFSGLGFLVVPVAKGEIYSALQMKMIDAGENTLPALIASKHYETARIFVTTNHSPAVFYMIFNTEFLNTLNPQEKIWLKEAFAEAGKKYESLKAADLQKLAQKNEVACLALSEQESELLKKNAENVLKTTKRRPWRDIFSSEKKHMEEIHK